MKTNTRLLAFTTATALVASWFAGSAAGRTPRRVDGCPVECQCAADSLTTYANIPPEIASFGINISNAVPGCCDVGECASEKCTLSGIAWMRATPGYLIDMIITAPGGGGGADWTSGLRVHYEHSGVCGSFDYINFYAATSLVGTIKVFCADC